jgi:hypothetical protein
MHTVSAVRCNTVQCSACNEEVKLVELIKDLILYIIVIVDCCTPRMMEFQEFQKRQLAEEIEENSVTNLFAVNIYYYCA